MRYVRRITSLIDEQLKNMEQFSLIKLENFQNPSIYAEVCNILGKLLKDKNIDFIGKLSRERFIEWKDEIGYENSINEMYKKGLIEENGSLTKWRNEKFLTTDCSKVIILLMGTELVVDKGGLADFYTISPETIEHTIKDNYSSFFNINSEIIDNIYRNLFHYVEKDLYKLDRFALENIDLDQESQIIPCILESLDEVWSFPNLISLTDLGANVLSNNDDRIKIFEKAYKFNRRIGLDNLPSPKKLGELKKKIERYYEKNALDLDIEFEKLFPSYDNYESLKNDLLDYYSGIDVDDIRRKLIKCDFISIEKIIGLKVKDKHETKDKNIKVYGNPISALCIPLTKLCLSLDDDEKKQCNKAKYVIEEIKLANVSLNEDSYNIGLYNKWNQMRRFLNGIDTLISSMQVCSIDSDINVEFISNSISNEEFHPLLKQNISELISSDILKEASTRDSVSKITYVIEIESDNSIIRRDRFVWYVFDTDSWINVFDIIDKSNVLNEDKLYEIAYYLPIGVSKDVERAVEVTNIDEFHEIYERLEINYLNCKIDVTLDNPINPKAYELGKKFIQMLRLIEENGFLGSLRSQEILDYFKTYRELIDVLQSKMQNTTLEAQIYELSKVMTYISIEEDRNKKGSQITVIPAYHPVMLEKIVQRYIYLVMGIDELIMTDEEEMDISDRSIDRLYSKLDQLATITSATAATINTCNRYEDNAKTFGYYTFFGKLENDRNDISINASYTKEDDELENVSGKLIATPVSNYIKKTIINYLSIYPYKVDGLRVMFFNPSNFSDIIAAFKAIVDKHKKGKSNLRLELVIYTDDYRCKVYNYLKSWIDNNISEDDSISLIAKIKYFDYKKGNSLKIAEEAIQNGDITFMFEIMEEVERREEPVIVQNSIDTMFPSTYLPIPKNDNNRRFLAISQLQFECERSYTQLLASIKHPHMEKNNYQIIQESQLRNEFIDIIQVLHEKSNWVVVLDENVDPSLIKFTGNEIIGYSTGEGYFGELNATISSSSSILDDIERYLIKRMKVKFSNWTNEEIKIAAKRCIEYTYDLDGAEVLKAINPKDEAINNYLAFYLSTIIEHEAFDQSKYYYRQLLSLDLYDQLFEDGRSSSGYSHVRPDFLLIEVPKNCNSIEDLASLKINIRIIECKMGGTSYMISAIDHAKEQVYEGYKMLRQIWKNPTGVKKRYWHNQLYKILTLQNSINMTSEELDLYAKKLMSIFNGNYEIKFTNFIYSFSTEQEQDFVKILYKEDIEIEQINFGSLTTRSFLLGEQQENVLDFMYLKGIEVQNKNTDNGVLESKEQEIEKPIEDIFREDELDIQVDEDIHGSGTSVGHKEVKNKILNEIKGQRFIKHDSFVDIFKSYSVSYSPEEKKNIELKLDRLVQELKLRKTKIFIKGYVFGPDIIRVELDLATGVNIDQFKKYDNDMKYWLSINEKPFIYIKDGKIIMDIIRKNRQTVGLKNMLDKIRGSNILDDCKEKFYTLLGADILGEPQLIDFSDSNTPHLLVAGQTGSGKSVLLNSMLISIMMMYTPEEVEMILVDPKFIELTIFSESPYTKVVATEAEEALNLLEGLVEEMNNRYKIFMESRSKSISSYNVKVEDDRKMKRILMVFDEYAALMEENKEIAKRLESAIKILSQKARAAGIHLIICTQSPRADIITTTIRNNLTARVGLRVADTVASGLILDTSGAETLLGKGDMLLKTAASSEFLRAKSPYVTELEIEIFVERCQEVYK